MYHIYCSLIGKSVPYLLLFDWEKCTIFTALLLGKVYHIHCSLIENVYHIHCSLIEKSIPYLLLFDWEKCTILAQLDALSNWRPGGRGFNHRRGRQHSFMEIDHEIFSTVILSLPLIQEGQMSVSGERMCTILVNRLEY